MELYFLALVKNHSQLAALGSLESVSIKKRCVTRKKATRKSNLQLVKFSTLKIHFLKL